MKSEKMRFKDKAVLLFKRLFQFLMIVGMITHDLTFYFGLFNTNNNIINNHARRILQDKPNNPSNCIVSFTAVKVHQRVGSSVTHFCLHSDGKTLEYGEHSGLRHLIGPYEKSGDFAVTPATICSINGQEMVINNLI